MMLKGLDFSINYTPTEDDFELLCKQIESRPLATRLPAELGWRAILVDLGGAISVVQVNCWGVEAPVIQSRLEQMMNIPLAPGNLWPLDDEGKKLDPRLLCGLVGPGESLKDAVKAIKAKYEEFEAKKQPPLQESA